MWVGGGADFLYSIDPPHKEAIATDSLPINRSHEQAIATYMFSHTLLQLLDVHASMHGKCDDRVHTV